MEEFIRTCKRKLSVSIRFLLVKRHPKFESPVQVLVFPFFILFQTCAMFVWFISRTFSANEQYFSLMINQPTVLSAMVYQLREQYICVLQLDEG